MPLLVASRAERLLFLVMTPPSEIKAVVIEPIGSAIVKSVPLPQQREDYILVRTTAVALNPTDWKHVLGSVMLREPG